MQYADGYMSSGDEYAPAVESETLPSTNMQPGNEAAPGIYQSPAWESTPRQLTPGVPDPQSRGSTRPGLESRGARDIAEEVGWGTRIRT